MVGRSLLAGLVRAVSVVMVGVLAAFGSCGAYPSLCVAVRAWCLRRVLTAFTPAPAKISLKALMNLASRSRMRKRKHPVCEVHEQVAGLLGGPGAVRVGGHAGYLHVPDRDLHDEQDVQTFEEDRAGSEEITGQQSLCLRTQGTPARRCPRSAGLVCACGRARSAARSLR